MITNVHIQVEPLDIRQASLPDLTSLAALVSEIGRERFPQSQPASLECLVETWRRLPSFLTTLNWVASQVDRREWIAHGNAYYLQQEASKNVLWFDISVLPPYRRQGLGRELLNRIAEAAASQQRSLLTTKTYSLVPAGEAFMLELGANPVQRSQVYQLDLGGVDPAMLRAWQKGVREQNHRFVIGLWKGAYPEDELERLPDLFAAVDDAPRDRLEIGDTRLEVISKGV